MTAYTLNLLDLFFTLHAIRNGATELNPFMQSVPVMVAWKVVGVGVLCRWLSHRPERIAKLGLRACTAVYTAVNFYHIYFIFGGALW